MGSHGGRAGGEPRNGGHDPYGSLPRWAAEPNGVPQPPPEPQPPLAPTPRDGSPAPADPRDGGGPRTGRAERRRQAQRAKRRRRRSAVREVPLLIGAALVIALLLKTFVVQPFSIPSGSMENTIHIGDRVVVDKLTPWFGAKPSRGDVVVFRDPGGWLEEEPSSGDDPPVVHEVKTFFTFVGLLPSEDEDDLIKRVIAVGGDTVACCDSAGRVTVNGHPIDESYLYPGNEPSTITFTVEVPRGRLFVMGDHRANSADSRYHLDEPGHGTISEDLVVGRAMVVAWPTGHWRGLDEPEVFAAVPDAGKPVSALDGGRHPRESIVAPVLVELPLVMTVVGVLPYRGAARLERSVRRRAWGEAHCREE